MKKQIKKYATELFLERGKNWTNDNEELFYYNEQSKEKQNKNSWIRNLRSWIKKSSLDLFRAAVN